MSGATEAIVYTTMNAGTAGGASAASSLFGAVATTGGVVIAGAAVYMAAKKMRADYQAALGEYNSRSDRESALFASQNAAFACAQQKARELSLSLSEAAREDPNTAFFLGSLGRLKNQIGGPSGDGPSDSNALIARCDELLDLVAAGQASSQWAAFEKLAGKVSQYNSQKKASSPRTSREAMALEVVQEQVAVLRAEINDSMLANAKSASTRELLLERLSAIEKVAASQPLTALQSLTLLQGRVRSEMRAAAEKAKRETKNAARMRELVGRISAHAQSVLQQNVLQAPRREAELALKKLSTLVTATPVELSALEALATETEALFNATEKAIEEQAMAAYLEDQVGQVLSGLGYRVTTASNGDDSKMVAVLDSGLGVRLNIDGTGNLAGEMVAFSESTAQVSDAAQEKVCNLMDDIFDGLRRRNLVVREKKRKNLKVGNDRVEVVKTALSEAEPVAAAAQKPLEMRVGN